MMFAMRLVSGGGCAAPSFEPCLTLWFQMESDLLAARNDLLGDSGIIGVHFNIGQRTPEIDEIDRYLKRGG
jgi:hypothetical protein